MTRTFPEVVTRVAAEESMRRALRVEHLLVMALAENGGCRAVALDPPHASGNGLSGRSIVLFHEWPRRRLRWLRGRGRCFCGDTR